jgi:hypothetical protein
MEWYDEYDRLIQFEKYESYCNCYKTYNAKDYYQNGAERYKTSEYISPIPDNYLENLQKMNNVVHARISNINSICKRIKEWQNYLLATCSETEFLNKQIATFNKNMMQYSNFSNYEDYEDAKNYALKCLGYFQNYKCGN